MRRLTGPFGLAVVITLVNAIKPVLVDDTAYLVFARHLAAHPLDPYDFTLHWYTYPDRAFDVLLPPVLPYWLALGIGVFGEHVVLLKLWLFPILWCFTASLNVLLRRFARGEENYALPLIVLSPAVLPTVNFMLDIPAAALALAAVAVFTKRGSTWRSAIAAGLIAGAAMQTKYTAMLAPAAMMWYGLTHRRIGSAILACALSAAVFGGWEAFLHAKYSESHFLHHLAEQRSESTNWLLEKSALIPGLFGHMGLLGFGIALVAARAVGVPNRFLVAVTAVWCIGVAIVCLLPDDSFRARNVWRPAGAAVLIAAGAMAGVLLFKRSRLRLSRDSWFVAGWLMIELAGYFALTPFPAARRVIGLTLVVGILAARLVSRVPARKPPMWVLPFAIGTGVLLAVADTWDARPEQAIPEQLNRSDGKTWFAGHWGFQYYCERAGFEMIVPGRTRLQPGDRLVLPIFPDDEWLYRPHIGNVPIRPPDGVVERIDILEWEDVLRAQTIPNLYGGNDPIIGRSHPRMTIAIYRIVASWQVPAR
ncbi:MAG: hypothetical protein U0791_19740 [Gemmataceae bacterium]